jgi:hypothetical protein
MFGAAYWPVLLVSSDIPTTLAPTPASATLTAPDPVENTIMAVSVVDVTLTGYDPADLFVGTVPTSADMALTAPSPDLTGSISEISPAPADVSLTAPSPIMDRPFALLITPAAMTLTTADPTVDYGFVTSSADPDFSGVPRENANSKEHTRQIAGVLNRLMQGKLNATATVTLKASTTQTYWRDGRLSPTSSVRWDPLTANAAAELTNGTFYVLEDDRKSGQWLLTHASAVSTDRKFRAVIIA